MNGNVRGMHCNDRERRGLKRNERETHWNARECREMEGE
jgi:hypothetical protein